MKMAPSVKIPLRRTCRANTPGYLLLEVLTYLALVAILLGVVIGVATRVRRGLVHGVAHRQQLNAWSEVKRYVRDDLRRAHSIASVVAQKKGQPDTTYWRVVCPNNEVVEYHVLVRSVKRVAKRDSQVLDRREFPLRVTDWQLKKAGTDEMASVWKLSDIKPGMRMSANGKPVYIQAHFDLWRPKGPPQAVLVGATTRCE